MKPTSAQYFFARTKSLRSVFWFLFIIAFIWFACLARSLLLQVYQPISDEWNLFREASFATIALLSAFLAALVVSSLFRCAVWPLLRPIYIARSRENGAPFCVGDHVQILVGRHKGRVAKVYSVWKDDCVRVELGEREKGEIKDVFDSFQLLKVGQSPRQGPSVQNDKIGIAAGSKANDF